MYVGNRLRYRRFPTREVRAGELGIGGSQPIRIQSMTTTPTGDVDATAAQVRLLVEHGCELVRITAPGLAEARALGRIRERLDRDGIRIPLCADIHYSPRAAVEAARHVEKIRINPGNFSGRPGREDGQLDKAEFRRGREQAREVFQPLLETLKSEGRCLRIGVNPGSLSQRMVQRYGDTAQGMVESALEYIRFCEDGGFRDLVLSMKSSNVRVMVYAYRELVARMRELGMNYPLHLGVTEAGGGIEGILKSAQGIGALLEDGIGDTIRVSLTDPPEQELAPARSLAEYYGRGRPASRLAYPECGLDYVSWSPRETHLTGDRGSRFRCGGSTPTPVTLSAGAHEVPGISPLLEHLPQPESRMPDTPGEASTLCRDSDGLCVTLFDSEVVHASVSRRIIPVEVIHDDVASWADIAGEVDEVLQFHITSRDVPIINSLVKYIHEHFPAGRTMLSIDGENLVHRYRLLELVLRRLNSRIPLDMYVSQEGLRDPLALAGRIGALLADGMIHSLTLQGDVTATGSRLFAFAILQGAGARPFATEYISCPGCGRTQFKLAETLQRIQSGTAHLAGLKIGVMGCVVNGPGEMADADFGYVGSAPGMVDLYVGRECVRRNVPEGEALQALIGLIRKEGRWRDASEASS